MADSGIQTATGNSEWLFPEAHSNFWFQYWIDTPGSTVEYRSSFRPRRTMHAGWIALASGLYGEPSSGLSFEDLNVVRHFYFDFETNLYLVTDGFLYYDRVIWNVPAGTTNKFRLIYP